MSEFKNADRYETAIKFSERSFWKTKSRFPSQGVVEFLEALEVHVERDRIIDEILHEWYDEFYDGDYGSDLQEQKRPAQFLNDIMHRWYEDRWHHKAMKRLRRGEYITEIAKWFYCRHQLSNGRWFKRMHEKSL